MFGLVLGNEYTNSSDSDQVKLMDLHNKTLGMSEIKIKLRQYRFIFFSRYRFPIF